MIDMTKKIRHALGGSHTYTYICMYTYAYTYVDNFDESKRSEIIDSRTLEVMDYKKWGRRVRRDVRAERHP